MRKPFTISAPYKDVDVGKETRGKRFCAAAGLKADVGGARATALEGSKSSWSLNLAIKMQEENPVYVLPEQDEEDAGKLTVVLDMDETLIHSVSPSMSPFQRKRTGRISPTKKAAQCASYFLWASPSR